MVMDLFCLTVDRARAILPGLLVWLALPIRSSLPHWVGAQVSALSSIGPFKAWCCVPSWASAEPISSEIATDMMVESFIGSPLFMRSLKMIRPRLNIVITFNVHDNHETSIVNPRVNDLVLTLYPSVN